MISKYKGSVPSLARMNALQMFLPPSGRSVAACTYISLCNFANMSEWSMMTGPENWRIAYPLFLLAMVLVGTSSYFLLKRITKNNESDKDS
jgi:hypothetical protein